MSNIKKLSLEDVLTIRRLLSSTDLAEADSFGVTEPLNMDKLSSAVERQNTGHGNVLKYNTIEDVAATLFYGIVMNHAFENGNKRTGLIVMLVFLDMNRTMIVNTDEDELYEFTRSVAAHELELPENCERRDSDSEVSVISNWISEHSREKVLGDKVKKFSELKSILLSFGCTFDNPKGNYIKIRRNIHTVKIGYPRHEFDVHASTIKKIRRDLHLSEIDGIDSSGFYDFADGVSSFVNMHRNLLKRLADL